jgi:hypothetical protein
MSLYRLLQQRAAAGQPVRVGLIGAGKFGSMFLNQVPTMAGLELSVIADLDPERARRLPNRRLGGCPHRADRVCRLGCRGGRCRAEGAERLRSGLLQGIWSQDRPERLVRGDVQALPADWAGTWHIGAVGCAASRPASLAAFAAMS